MTIVQTRGVLNRKKGLELQVSLLLAIFFSRNYNNSSDGSRGPRGGTQLSRSPMTVSLKKKTGGSEEDLETRQMKEGEDAVVETQESAMIQSWSMFSIRSSVSARNTS